METATASVSKRLNPDNLRSMGRRVLEIERDGIQGLLQRIDGEFVRACELMIACSGRIVVTGMGKSGHIGGKIAATLASTGTPAFFVHPGEASHGDLGMITRQDVVLAISYSGETAEIITILPLIKRMATPLIALTGKPNSTMAKMADVHLDVSVAQEACPMNLAPTASTTATLAMGDALAVALLEARGFTPEDFAMSHPGGSLGRKLLLKIDDVMQKGERIPKVAPGTPMTTALLEMTHKGMGMTAVVDAQDHIVGVYTDGDLRRSLEAQIDLRTATIDQVMRRGGYRARPDWLAAEAVRLMEQHKITALLVVDADDRLCGVIHMHDLLRAGVV